MPRLRTFTVDPVVRSSSKLRASALARVTARMAILGQALDNLADRPDDVVATQDSHHIQEQYHACCRALEQLKVVLDLSGPPIEWNRMPPHIANIMKELLEILVEPPKPAKARLKARIVKGTFALALALIEGGI